MTTAPEWTEAKLDELSTAQLKSLLSNARAKGANSLVALCEKALATRLPVNRPKRKASSSPLRKREEELALEIGELVTQLSRDCDLTPETATRLSRGTTGFRAHKPLSSDGTAKMGGLQRTRQCLINRYTSYRLRDIVISLDIWLPKGGSIEEIEFHVFAPKELLPDAVSRDMLRPTLPDIGGAPLSWFGKRFSNFAEAKSCFADLISRLAPKQQK